MRSLALLLCLLFVNATYYVGPSATATTPCTDSGSPCKPSAVWGFDLAPGDNVVLQNGTYQGADYMITTTSDDDGSSGSPITISCETDGGCWVDGEGTNAPVYVRDNPYTVVEGINAYASTGTVFDGLYADNITFRRCVGWDAGDVNSAIFITGADSLIEDCAGFGVARGIFASYDKNNITFRRIWGRFEGSTHTGPKNTFTAFYFNTGNIVDNAILTWDSGSMQSPWYNNDGTSILDGPYTDWEHGNPRGAMSHGQISGGEECADLSVYGLIAYIKGATSGMYNEFPSSRALIDFDIAQAPCCITLENIATFIDPTNSGWDSDRGIELGDGCTTQSPKDLSITDASAVDASGNYIHADWTATDVEDETSVAALADSIYVGSGAHICYRYEDGSATTTPLWPWPMQGRIFDATTFAADSGHTHNVMVCDAGDTPNCTPTSFNDPHAVADVMGDVFEIFGNPPPECKKGGTNVVN